MKEIKLSPADQKLFNTYDFKQYGALDLAYKLLELNLIPPECYEEMKNGVKAYLKLKTD